LPNIDDNILKQLILDCQNNLSSAQEKMYKVFSKKHFGICLRYATDYNEAEDMLQEGFVKLFRNMEKYNFTGSFKAWSSRLITNNCIDMLRKKPNLYTISDDNAFYLEANNLEAIDELIVEDLVAIIQKLPIGYRTIFNLYVIDGFSHKEIAEKLDINEGTSKSQLNRAKKLLQKKLEEMKLQEFKAQANYKS
jgi:RNA polymerase sigma factor (sigma-70 family)